MSILTLEGIVLRAPRRWHSSIAPRGRPRCPDVAALLLCAGLVNTLGCALFAGVKDGELESSGSPYAQAVLADKPIAYYRLGESTTPAALDDSGNGHDGIYKAVEVGSKGAI